MNNRTARDLIFVSIYACVASALTLAPINNFFVTTLFALPLVFFAPGYALMRALFPRRQLGWVETLTSSLGFSLAATIVGGLGLNWLPQGLSSEAWTLFLGGVTLVGIVIARIRRATPSENQWRLEINVESLFLWGVSIVVVIGAVWLARASAEHPSTSFTQLWTRPLESARVEVGIRHLESMPIEYRLAIEMNAQRVYDIAPITLTYGETWAGAFQLPVGQSEMRASLYRAETPGEVYRYVVWRSKNE